jgi:hypothetical protein
VLAIKISASLPSARLDEGSLEYPSFCETVTVKISAAAVAQDCVPTANSFKTVQQEAHDKG